MMTVNDIVIIAIGIILGKIGCFIFEMILGDFLDRYLEEDDDDDC